VGEPFNDKLYSDTDAMHAI